ncbi:MAG TPA: lysophospholipid acyltransferase family protein [Gemmatimonadaceae bacterium]|nr:lysophospholipid acyltransferase family protein [Gemmatimonadaceae bacterium]
MHSTLPLPAALPRRGGPLTRAFGRAVLRLAGWRLEGSIPDRPKIVVIAAPHRSNWDFVIGIAGKFALGVEVAWLGKHTLFRGPVGWLFRRWGGVPVDRRTPQATVATAIERFAHADRMVLALAPEGTRKAVEWKTGFWHIAHGAGVPIVPVAFDWDARAIRFMTAVEPTELAADMARLREQYRGVRGRGDRAAPSA